MSKHRLSFRSQALALSLVLASVFAPAQAGSNEQGPRRVPTAASVAAAAAAAASQHARVIVQFKADRASALSNASGENSASAAAPMKRAQSLAQRHGLALSDGNTIAPRMQVIHGTGLSSAALKQRLETDSTVEAVWIDERRHAHAAPNDPLYADNQTTTTPVSGQWYLRAPTSTVVSSINAEAAWSVTQGSSSIVVAVLDTGVRKDHPDLAGKLLPGYDFVGYGVTGSSSAANVAEGIATANDGDLADSDPSDPGDWVSQADIDSGKLGTGCTADDIANSSWHGTQTAGLIGAATNNGTGMASIGRNVKVLPVRVLGKCGGFDSDIIAGMRWAAGQAVTGVPTNPTPARVISMSLGSAGTCSTAYSSVIASLESLGVSVVVSAGNDSRAVNTPANCANVIAVSGLRHAGTKNGFASLGPEVLISAPAGNCVNSTGACLYPILSTVNLGATGPTTNSYTTGGNDYAVGTSFSAPLVAGTIGLMVSANPELTTAQVRSFLKQSARAFPTTSSDATVKQCVAPGTSDQSECLCTTSTCGAGMLDAGVALKLTQASSSVASFIASSTAVVPGTAVTLDASGTTAPVGSTVSSYAWSVIDGASIAAITSATNTPVATLTTTGTGTVTVMLTITTNKGETRSSTQQINVSTTAANAGESGGGAASPGWLLGLLLATLVLMWTRHGGGRRD